MLCKAFLLTWLILSGSEGARILGIFPMPGISHYILASKLMKGLAEDGHDIVMVSPYALKDPPKNGSFTDIVLEGLAEDFQKLLATMDMFGQRSWSIWKFKNLITEMTRSINGTLHHPKLTNLVESKEKFDALIIEEFLNDALKVYAHLFNCPLIVLSSVGPNPKINNLVGNPQPASYVAHLQAKRFSSHISFLDRFNSLLFYVSNSLIFTFFTTPKNQEILNHKYPDAPSIRELEKHTALVLLNSHVSLYDPQHLVPNMVEIGGYFIDPPKPLPKDLKEYMDNATDGVIYFSMGSNLKSKDMSEERKRIFLNILGRLKQRVIWKFEEDLPDKPSNVLIRSWCPQQDILAHPNMRLFITHGGLLSTTETIYHGVPILAIPVFADQPANAARAVDNGYALRLDYNDPDFTEEKLGYLINELLRNPSYREVAQNKSRIYHDRPMKPMETAVFWVGYVIRHHGASHLMVAAKNLPWYELYMIDVALSVVLILASTLYLWVVVVKKIARSIWRKTAIKQKIA